MDEYAEELYEESMEIKSAAARRLLRLCLRPSQLGSMAEHTTVLGVLSRELRENAKRSHELAAAITGVFLCLAHFSSFHRSLTHHQVPEASLRVLEYDTKRRLALQKELKATQSQLAEKGEGNANAVEAQSNLKREERKHRGKMERLDRLTLLCLLLLRDLCQDSRVEARLVKQNLCKLLIPLLARKGEDLVLATLGFLHKLCICAPNKDSVVQSSDALARLAELTAHSCADVACLALRLCFNLSFDPLGSQKLATQTTLLVKLPAVAQQPATRKLALRLLCNLTAARWLRPLFASKHDSCISLALRLLAQGQGQKVGPEAAALCVDFAADGACAARMMDEHELFPKVVLTGIQTADTLSLKVARNAASHPASRAKLLRVMSEGPHGDPSWLTRLLRLAEDCHDRPEVLVEALGIFAGLDCASPEVPWPELCAAGLLDLLHRHLMVGFADDDALLEAVQLAGTLAMDPACAAMLASSKVPQDIPPLLLEKTQDGDLVVQLLFTLRCLLLQDDTCDLVMKGPLGAARAVIDAVRAGRQRLQLQAVQAVETAADEVLELILKLESEDSRERQWTHRIKEFRFELHNEQWCQRLRGSPDLAGGAKASAAAKTGAAFRIDGTTVNGGYSWAGATSLADRVWDPGVAAALD